jgi:hypothetical protein
MQKRAVFTGDIVRSGDLDSDALAVVFAAFTQTAQDIGGWPDLAAGSGGCLHDTVVFARFRGDGWQMALPARFALRAALVMRAALRATGKGRETRIGIGIGMVEMNGDDLASAQGPAFVQSGHALDGIKRAPLLTAPDGPVVLRAILPLADRITSGWTPKQAQIALHLLAPAPPTHEALAARLGHSRQLIQKQADAAGIVPLTESIEIYETL